MVLSQRDSNLSHDWSNRITFDMKPLRRLPSRLDYLYEGSKLDVRAHQRTYEGAYTRSAVGCLSFSILLLKIFSKEFLPIGTIYSIYGTVLYFFGVKKGRSVDFFYNPQRDQQYYKTSGDTVLYLTVLSLVCYLALLILVLRM